MDATPGTTDREVIDADTARDDAAPLCLGDWVTALVRAHRSGLLAQARGLGLDAEEAFDCVQEAFQTFLRLPQARDVVGDREGSSKLLAVIVRNAARTRRRRNRVARARASDGGTDALEVARDEGAGAEERVALAEQAAQLRVCVGALSEVQRAVVTLRLLEERPGEDVASALGLSAQHVAVLLHRARAALRGCMEAAGHTPVGCRSC